MGTSRAWELMPVVLRATSRGFLDEGGMPRRAVRMVPTASWQMVGSSKVGFRGLGVKIGGRPMPEMMRSTVRLAGPFLDLEEGG